MLTCALLLECDMGLLHVNNVFIYAFRIYYFKNGRRYYFYVRRFIAYIGLKNNILNQATNYGNYLFISRVVV